MGYIQHNVLFLSEEDITATLTPEDVILVSEQVFYMAGEARISCREIMRFSPPTHLGETNLSPCR